ncbi:hypothetical protein BGW39_010839 [Mortierella sp. 14UC]|nr:hypothetical protein BGW39_010839 [Mortierella sp. 14UC]
MAACWDTMVSQPTLIFLLQSSPHLSKLVLARVTHYTRLDHTTHLDDPTPSIVDSIGIHCPNVKAFHISVSQSHEEVIDQELLSVFEKLPKVEEYSFIIDNLLEPHLMDGLRTVANRVTTLNLLPRQQYTSWVTGVPLGEILCTFKHLVHFRAPTAVYYHEDMDLHNVLQRTPNRTNISSKTVARQYIWTCRLGMVSMYSTPSDEATAGSKVVEVGWELGMDLSKVGHIDDLLEWLSEHYGSMRTPIAIPTPNVANFSGAMSHCKQLQQPVWPKLQSFWIQSIMPMPARVVKETMEFLVKARPNVGIRLNMLQNGTNYGTVLRQLL